MDTSKRIYKDLLFRAYFKEPEHFVQLCNAVTGLNLQAAQLQEKVVTEILFSSLRNDVSFKVDEQYFVFFEHQSTVNFNMPLRMLFYMTVLYRGEVKEDLIYQTKMLNLAAPKFFVFYNGKNPYPEESTLKLSDSFAEAGDIELTVKVYNINYNKDYRLIRKCRPAHDYSFFVDKVETNRANGMERDEAILLAINECIKRDIMREWLEAHRSEVFEMINLVWDEEAARKSYIAQGLEEGLEKGLKEGLKEGRRETSLENIRNLMESLQLTASAAMNALKISPEMQKELAPLI